MRNALKVLVTGGAGYVGSHACKTMAIRGWTPIVVDNLSTGNRDVVRWGDFYDIDIRDTERLTQLLKATRPDSVLHFAASAYVGESTHDPLAYYDNNVTGTISLLRACMSIRVPNVVFSSSCAAYGLPKVIPIHEGMPTKPISPYGETKVACERLFHWAQQAYGTKWISLRYFNAAGADPEGELGEMHDPETHLLPLALRAAMGRGPVLSIFGDDHPTEDGTAIRDYVHVSDLADAHVSAIDFLMNDGDSQIINLGSGRGHSVRQVIDTVERVTGLSVPYQISSRRIGDPPELWTHPRLAGTLLRWKPRYTELVDIVSTAWKWECHVASRSGR